MYKLAIILSALAVSTASGAPLTIMNNDRGGSLVTEDGNMYVKGGTKTKDYNGYVVIHASPWQGWRVAVWKGACKGRAPNLCRVLMDKRQTVRVIWERIPESDSSTPRAYTSNGHDLGAVIGSQPGLYVSVLTDAGYSIELDMEDGHPRTGVYYVAYDDMSCTGAAWTQEHGPGIISQSVGEGIVTWVDLSAKKREVIVYSSWDYDDSRCVSNASGFTWQAYPAKMKGRDNIRDAGLPATLPWAPIEIR